MCPVFFHQDVGEERLSCYAFSTIRLHFETSSGSSQTGLATPSSRRLYLISSLRGLGSPGADLEYFEEEEAL